MSCGSNWRRSRRADATSTTRRDETRFDHIESFYIGVEVTDLQGDGEVIVNVLGNVAENPIDEIFYENRGQGRASATSTARSSISTTSNGCGLPSHPRLGLKYFRLDGFYARATTIGDTKETSLVSIRKRTIRRCRHLQRRNVPTGLVRRGEESARWPEDCLWSAALLGREPHRHREVLPDSRGL